MRHIRLVPDDTKFQFMTHRRWAFPMSVILIVVSLGLFAGVGLNLGIDFVGGTLIEVRDKQGPADIGEYRATLGALNLGDIQVQEFGEPTDVLIRVERQIGGEEAQQRALYLVREALAIRWIIAASKWSGRGSAANWQGPERSPSSLP